MKPGLYAGLAAQQRVKLTTGNKTSEGNGVWTYQTAILPRFEWLERGRLTMGDSP